MYEPADGTAMSALHIIRYAAWAAIAALVIVVGGLVLGPKLGGLDRLPLAANIGGPFTLTTAEGQRFSDTDLRGKPFAIFFGFTNCPDVCPTTLLEMTNRLADLGAAGDKLNIVFVSVDPEADTPEFLKRYMKNFDSRIIGLTGTKAEIDNIVTGYRVVVQRVPTSTGYTINHTATTFLMDASGRLSSTLAYEEQAATQLAKLRQLVGLPQR
jgi:protein SCO1